MPPSTRFMGRRVYWAGVIVVVVALRQNRADGKLAHKLRRELGISYKTFARWLIYFREVFPCSEKWKRLRGRVVASVQDSLVPGSLLQVFLDFCASATIGLISCLQFLA